MIRFEVEKKNINMTVHPHKSIQMKVEKAVAVGISGKTYEGDYEVIPTAEKQTMGTKQKYMKDDVTIHPIPFYSVSNNSGGNTVFIGSEVLTYGNQ